MNDERLIISAASEAYGTSLLALIGALNLNWPDHPPLLVYDIGMAPSTLSSLDQHNISVRKVPKFCSHWREHFTWKIWCLNDAPARDVLWMDAGTCPLAPLPEVFDALDSRGYFLVDNGQQLVDEASAAACQGCGVSRATIDGLGTLSGGFMGFRKFGTVQQVLTEALSVALNEAHIAASHPRHRHDQAIISLLMYKYLSPLEKPVAAPYTGWTSPRQVEAQKVWTHRRSMLEVDTLHFREHLSKPGKPHIPKVPGDRGTTRFLLRVLGLPRRFIRQVGRKMGLVAERRPSIYNGVRD